MNDENLKKEIREFYKLKKELFLIESRIEKNSTYNINDIGKIITKLMEAFEGVEFIFQKPDYFINKNYKISEKEKSQLYIQYQFKCTEIKPQKLNLKTEKDLCKLYPTGYIHKRNVLQEGLEYIQNFIDYLFEKRMENNLDKIDMNKLEEILSNYLIDTKDWQLQRKNDRADQINKINEHNEKRKNQEKCIVDRKSLFDAICYIINNYEDEKLVALQEIKEGWNCSSQWSTLNLFRRLKIKQTDIHKEVYFDALIGSDGSYPDEERWIHIDENQNGFVKFFEVKSWFKDIYNSTNYFNLFMDELEKLYSEKKVLESNDIEFVLSGISNKCKQNKKILKK